MISLPPSTYIDVEAKSHPCLTTQTPNLRRLATLAQELYDGTRSGTYLAPLPIGAGKTQKFLIPFAAYCAKTTPARGLILAIERMDDVVNYAGQINEKVGQDAAFGLVTHHRRACPRAAEGLSYDPEQCQLHHKKYAAQAPHYPVLLLTHEMLFRRRDRLEKFQQWNGGKRVMVIFDEKPGPYWHVGRLTEQDLNRLIGRLGTHKANRAVRQAQDLLHKRCHGETLSIPPDQAGHLLSSFFLEEEEGQEDASTALRSLYALSQSHGGMVVKDRRDLDGKQVIISHRFPLPDMPTLILDATGKTDPAYPQDISSMPTDLEEMQDDEQQPSIDLVRFDETFTKAKWFRKPEKAEQILVEHLRQLEPELPDGPVYFLAAKDIETRIETMIKEKLPDYRNRYILNHYGATKGSNEMREAGTIVVTSVQFKPRGLYRALAQLAGQGDIAAETIQTEQRLSFNDQDLENIQLKDQLVTLVQEIGRTRIRKEKNILVYLPWSNQDGLSALRKLLEQQFQARVHCRKPIRRLDDREGRFMDYLIQLTEERPGERVPKKDIRKAIGVQKEYMPKLLKRAKIQQLMKDLDIGKDYNNLLIPKQCQPIEPPTQETQVPKAA